VAFSKSEILEEFCEAARIRHAHRADADTWLWRRYQALLAQKREYNSRPDLAEHRRAYWKQYYAKNREKRLAYMRKYEAEGRRKAWIESPAGIASAKKARAKYAAAHPNRHRKRPYSVKYRNTAMREAYNERRRLRRRLRK
jgi:predicted metal-dependent phosphoesterase TrpH